MPALSERLTSEPIPLGNLHEIISSPDRDLLVARTESGRVVGSAVMNLIIFTSGRKAWVEDFVVSDDETIRGAGVGFGIWQEAELWARERQARIELTSSAQREAAHVFYKRQGGTIKPTCVFVFGS